MLEERGMNSLKEITFKGETVPSGVSYSEMISKESIPSEDIKKIIPFAAKKYTIQKKDA